MMFSKFSLLALSSSLAAALPSLLVFGDSLSDIGNVLNYTTNTIPYWKGRYSNGPVWGEYTSKIKNYTLVNYAYGGATSDNDYIEAITKKDILVPSAHEEIQDFIDNWDGLLTEEQMNEAIIAVEIGSNDYLNLAPGLVLGKISAKEVADNIVKNIIEDLKILIDFGFKKFLVTNIPAIQVTPAATRFHTGFLFGSYVNETNFEIAANFKEFEKSSQENVDWIRLFDVFTLLDVVHQRDVAPEFGIENRKDACNRVVRGNLKSCEDSNNHLFFDDVHPTTRIHALAGILACNVIDNADFVIDQRSILQVNEMYNLTRLTTENNPILDENDNIFVSEYGAIEANSFASVYSDNINEKELSISSESENNNDISSGNDFAGLNESSSDSASSSLKAYKNITMTIFGLLACLALTI